MSEFRYRVSLRYYVWAGGWRSRVCRSRCALRVGMVGQIALLCVQAEDRDASEVNLLAALTSPDSLLLPPLTEPVRYPIGAGPSVQGAPTLPGYGTPLVSVWAAFKPAIVHVHTELTLSVTVTLSPVARHQLPVRSVRALLVPNGRSVSHDIAFELKVVPLFGHVLQFLLHGRSKDVLSSY
jgi:hypothetical protein